MHLLDGLAVGGGGEPRRGNDGPGNRPQVLRQAGFLRAGGSITVNRPPPLFRRVTLAWEQKGFKLPRTSLFRGWRGRATAGEGVQPRASVATFDGHDRTNAPFWGHRLVLGALGERHPGQGCRNWATG